MSIRKYFDPYLDLRAIGLFRIFLAGVLILDLLFVKWPNLEAFYTDSGLLDQSTLQSIVDADSFRAIYNWGLLSFFDSANGVGLFFILTLISYLCVAVGYRTKLFSIVAFIALWSIHQRNSFVLSGPDELMINLLFIALFLPLDQRFSLFKSKVDIEKNKLRGMASFYVLFFIGLVYFFQAFLKTGNLWENGEAISYALQETIWTNSSASWLHDRPGLCSFLTKSTLWIEYSIPALLFFPFFNKWTRLLAVFLLIGLHGTIFMFLDLGLFPLIVPTFCVLLLPSSFFNKMGQKLQRVKLKKSPIELKPVFALNGKYAKLLSIIVLAGTLILVTWKSALSSNSIKQEIPNPSFMKHLGNTSMFFQYWGFYAPNPSVTHGWFKVMGTSANGQQIDLRTGESITFDDSDLSAYRDYSWNVFYYKTNLYYYVNSPTLMKKWSEFELAKALQDRPELRITSLQIIGFRQQILSATENGPIQSYVISESRINR